MLVVRVVALVAVLVAGGSLIAFLVTRDRRFLRFAVQVLKYTLIAAILVLLLFAVDHLAGHRSPA